MREIRMVDLKTQYNKIKTEVDSAISEVIEQSSFINGPAVKKFREGLKKYLGVKNAISCANGTDAIQIALMALDLDPGDEIITPDFGFISCVEVINLLKLKAVLVNVDQESFNLDVESLKKAITKKTKAIIPIHLFGQCANMEKINQIAKQYNLYVIEDMAQAVGTEYIYSDSTRKMAGNLGDIACASFFPSKNLGCYGDGGAIFTNNDILAEKINLIANHGSKIKYKHSIIGVNSRLDSIQAAILNIKLKYIDEYIGARQKAADYYDSAFISNPKLIIPKRVKYSTHSFHQYTIKCNGINNMELQKFLKSRDIPSMIYYPAPLHKQDALKENCSVGNNLEITETLCNQVISLPMHTELDIEQLEYICNNILDFANKN
ncbi:DegT/DnrJ/EryC1/StrS family aminotransferase [Bacteroidota bacterium]